MKKIISILLIAVCSTPVIAQKEISAEEFFARYQTKRDSLYECFFGKEYKTGERLDNELIDLFNQLSKKDQETHKEIQGDSYYDLACIYSLQNQTKKAVDAFRNAIEYGYINYSHAKNDADMDNIRNDKQFIALMDGIREKGDYLYILRKAGKYQPADTTGLPHFTYEAATSNNLKNVREFFKLDSIAGQGDEISKIIHLMTWIHNNIRHDGSNFALCEFDAIDIYNYHKSTGKGVNCRHLAIALNEMYLSMGFQSRYVGCIPKNENDRDSHVINCVYSNTLQKWVWMDPTFNAYIKDENGNLLSIEEVRERLIDDRPLVLNEDADWNNENKQTKEIYLDSYMAKNLYWLQCPTGSKFNVESRYRKNNNTYVCLYPTGFERNASNTTTVITNDPSYFWQIPK